MPDRSADPAKPEPPSSTAKDVQHIMRKALTGALATLERETGHPYASLVTVATAPAGEPIMLLSRLAKHTRNLLAEPRVSLMLDATSGTADPLAGGRVTVIGRIEVTADPGVRRRFLARHPTAEAYASFQDFAFYRLVPERAHFIGGFGRIVELAATEFLIDISRSQALIDAEPDIVSHMNSDHADAIALYGSALLGAHEGSWSMTGIDPMGTDLMNGRFPHRLDFVKMLESPGDARRALANLADAARGSSRLGKEGLT